MKSRTNAVSPEREGSGETPRSRRQWLREHSELGICLLLAAIAVLVLVDTMLMSSDFTQRGPIGPKTMPTVVGASLLVVSVLLAIDVLRGNRGEAEYGEDIDLSVPSDWRTVLLLSAAFLANAALIDFVGFPLSGVLLFWGSAYALGSRGYARDFLIAVVLSVVTYFAFDRLLGVPLPGGPLMGVL